MMFQRGAKIAGVALVGILAGCIAFWLEANYSAPVSAAEWKEVGPLPERERPAYDTVRAYHLRDVIRLVGGTDELAKLVVTREVWAVRDVGRREERREGSKLVSVVVDTPRWRFSWNVLRNRVVASPSHLEDLWARAAEYPRKDRTEVLRVTEYLTGISVIQKEWRGDREVEKITEYAPPGAPSAYETSCIHVFRPKKHLKLPGTQFLNRVHWFDPKTGRLLGRRCGCKPSVHEYWVDFPEPESVPRELFRFEVPRDATLEVKDPELGREIRSKGQTGPDPRK
jgi:hypothetical protein